jgi:hypothetical protein
LIEHKEDLKEKRKVYLKTEKAKIANIENVKRYREQYKEMLLEKRRANITHCECGSIYQSKDKYQHNKTKKHLSYINNK